MTQYFFFRFLANVFAVGQCYAFALYFESLLVTFGQSQSTKSWV